MGRRERGSGGGEVGGGGAAGGAAGREASIAAEGVVGVLGEDWAATGS